MKISGLSKCRLAVLLLTGSECVVAETAERGQEVANWRRARSTPTEVAFVVPAHLRERRRQEIEGAKYAALPEDEQQAVAELHQAIGYGFQCTIENGRITAITFTREMDGALPAGILSRFRSVRSVWFYGGRFPMAGLVDLQLLTELKHLGFSGSAFEAGSLAMLEGLGQLESLHSRNSRGLRDDDLKYLAGMTQLKRLSFYAEDDRYGGRPGESRTVASPISREWFALNTWTSSDMT